MPNEVIAYMPWKSGKRRYIVHLPPRWTARTVWPVIFAFHGGGAAAESIRNQSRLNLISEKYGVVIVYPDGYAVPDSSTLRTWNALTCCGPALRAHEDEIELTAQLVEDVRKRYAADLSRLYATGFSNGAMLTHLIGAQLSRIFAAIAPVSGDMPVLKMPAPQVPCPIVYFQGKRDTYLPWEGGKGTSSLIPGAPKTAHNSAVEGLAWWRDANQAARDPIETSGPGYEKVEYPATSDGAPAILYTLPAGGHQWPGGRDVPQLGDPIESRVDASEIIWAFFRRFRR